MTFERIEEGADLLDEEEHARRQRHVDDRRGLAGRARRRPGRGRQHLDVVEAGSGGLLAQPRRHARRAVDGAHAADAAGERDREPSRSRADLEPVVAGPRQRLQQRQLGRGVGVRAGREDIGHRPPLVGGRRLLAHPLALLVGGALERAPGGERLRLGGAQRASGLVGCGRGVCHGGHGTTGRRRTREGWRQLSCSDMFVLGCASTGSMRPGKRRFAMAAPTFDTHDAVRKLRGAGIDEQAAEGIVESRGRSYKPTFVTREILQLELRGLRSELRSDHAELRSELYRALWILGAGIVAVMSGLTAAAVAVAALIG